MKVVSHKLNQGIETLREHIQIQDINAPQISKASVYWHIQHSLLTIEKIFQSLKESNPDSYKPSFKMGKLFVLTTGIIPRRRAESPLEVRPNDIYTYEQINKEVQKIQNVLPMFAQLPVHAYFEHPFLGKLKTNEAIRFLVIHTHHHIKIIRDILKFNGRSVL